MKITGIELFHIAIPFAKPYHLAKAYGTLHDAHAVVFKLHTDEGIVGLGEADPMNPFTEETPGTVMSVTREAIAPLILWRDPGQIPAIERMLDQSIQGHPTARGAINMFEFGITQAALLQVGCTLPNLIEIGHAFGSVVRMSDDVTDFGQNIHGATVRVPAGNGLGVELDEEKLKKYTKDYVKI